MARNEPRPDAQVHDPTSAGKHKDYQQSDIEHVLRVRQWSSWNELADWLRREGDADNELTPGEAGHMADDIERLAREGHPFTTDPGQVFASARNR